MKNFEEYNPFMWGSCLLLLILYCAVYYMRTRDEKELLKHCTSPIVEKHREIEGYICGFQTIHYFVHSDGFLEKVSAERFYSTKIQEETK